MGMNDNFSLIFIRRVFLDTVLLAVSCVALLSAITREFSKFKVVNALLLDYSFDRSL